MRPDHRMIGHTGFSAGRPAPRARCTAARGRPAGLEVRLLRRRCRGVDSGRTGRPHGERQEPAKVPARGPRRRRSRGGGQQITRDRPVRVTDVKPHPSKVGVVRKFAAIVLAAAFVASVAACSDLPAEVQGCVPKYTVGRSLRVDQRATARSARTRRRTFPRRRSRSASRSRRSPRAPDCCWARTTSQTCSSRSTPPPTASSSARRVPPPATAGPRRSRPTSAPSRTRSRGALQCERVGTRVVSVLTAAQYFGSASDCDERRCRTEHGHRRRRRHRQGLPRSRYGHPAAAAVRLPVGGHRAGRHAGTHARPAGAAEDRPVRVGARRKRREVKAGEKVLLQVQAIEWTEPRSDHDLRLDLDRPHPAVLHADTRWPKNATEPVARQGVGQGARRHSGSAARCSSSCRRRTATRAAKRRAATRAATLIFVYDILGTY